MLHYSHRSTAPNAAGRILLVASPILMLFGLEVWLARVLDDHFAAVTITLIVAVVGIALAAPLFSGRS